MACGGSGGQNVAVAIVQIPYKLQRSHTARNPGAVGRWIKVRNKKNVQTLKVTVSV